MRDHLPPGILAGAWDEANGHDRAAVASLAGRPYDEVGLALTRLADRPDPPVGKIGHAWRLTAPLDAFLLAAGGPPSAKISID